MEFKETEAQKNYPLAIEQALKIHSSTTQRFLVIAQILQEWTEIDVETAVSWLLGQKDSISHTYNFSLHLSDVLKIYIEKEPYSAGKVLADLPASNIKQSLIHEYVFRLAEGDPLEALEWTNNISERQLRQNAQRTLYQSWINDDPYEALDHVSIVNSLEDPVLEELLIQTANQLSAQNPELFSDRINQYAESIRPQLAYSVVTHWIEQDINGATRWIQSLDKGLVKDRAIQSYMDFTGGYVNPATAFHLVEDLSDSTLQFDHASRVFETWAKKDPDEAIYALSNSEYLGSVKKRLLLTKVQQK